MVERTLVIIKPDAVGRRLCGDILGRYEQRGLKIVALKLQRITRAVAEKHYAEHRGRDFFEDLVGFITSAPTVLMVLEGPDAVEVVRQMNGTTHCRDAAPGTIRGDYGLSRRNLVHASDSEQSAAREIDLFFDASEVVDYRIADEQWLWSAL